MIKVVKITFLSFNKKSLINISKQFKSFDLGYTMIGPLSFPTKKNKFCILRSPFKHKDSREYLELRIYKDIYLFKLNSIKRAYIFLTLLFDNLNLYNTKDLLVKMSINSLY